MMIDWQDLWVRLRHMLWATLVLGVAGLTVGLWVYGVTLHAWHTSMPTVYADLLRPNLLQEAIRVTIGWLQEWEAVVIVLWVALVMWLYLVPEVCGRRQLWAAMLGMGGMILAWLVDQVPEWGGGEQYVRFGVLLGVGCYLGMGWGIRERGSRLARRVLEGAVTGGVIGLLAAFGAEVSTVGMVAGMEPETMLIVPPVVWGAVVGWTVTGGRECLSGSQDLAAALRERWPLVVGVILVVVNAVGSVITMLP